ncbi:hypothetical protein BT63DRAFT_459488 [Microthyrium microscopicum]|uniref:Uncharacterized protein n=1 Tax=Microthyrium microscopicum TaxID=703497 RepID=A0A6A6TYG5_9PEZI|nr:hypothetical protein BT63DRAFT_459488 [Microthyrium microscopicum]
MPETIPRLRLNHTAPVKGKFAMFGIFDTKRLQVEYKIDLEDLECIALRAYGAMQETWPGALNHLKPRAMTAMLVDSKLYLCSSIKGGPPSFIDLLDPESKERILLANHLQNSQLIASAYESAIDHTNGGNCGELHALYRWIQDNPGHSFPNTPDMLITTAKSGGQIMSPCGREAEESSTLPRGCFSLMKFLCLRASSKRRVVDHFDRYKRTSTMIGLLRPLTGSPMLPDSVE